MRLVDRQFTRALRQKVRREVKTRLEWREVVRRRRWSWLSKTFNITVLRWIIPFVFANCGFFGVEKDALWLIFSLWTIFMAMLRVAQFQTFHSRGGGMMPFVCLPVSTGDVFAHSTARIFRTSLWLLVDVLGALAVAALRDEVSPLRVWVGAVPAALIIWLSSLSIAVFLYWRFPRVPYVLYATGLCALLIISPIVVAALQINLGALSPAMVTLVLDATPSGWASQLGRWLTGQTHAFPVVPGGLLMIWLALSVAWYRAIAARHIFWDVTPPPPTPLRKEALVERPASEESSEQEEVESVVDERATQTEAVIRSGDFLRPFFAQPSLASRHGWVERFATSHFRQDAALLDYMLGKPPGWSRNYRRALVLMVFGAVLAGAISAASVDVATWILFLLPGLGLLLMTPVLGGHWPGFYLGAMQQRNLAVMAILPVDLRAAVRMVWGINARRFLLALPCWLLVGALAAYFLNVSPEVALRISAECWALALALQPVMIVCKYSIGTNDTSRWYVASGVILFCFVMLGVLVATITVMFASTLAWQLTLLAVTALLSSGGAAIYRRLYFGRHFDLLAKRPPTSNLVAAE